MKVILNKDYASLGEEGDIVNVKNGYARNFLIPQNIAVLDTRENRSYFKAKEGAIAKRKEEKRLASRSIYEKLQNYEIVVALPTGDNGKLFGSVTTHMIHDKLFEEGIEVDRKKIELPSVIKSVGSYNVEIGLYGGEKASVKLTVNAIEKKEEKNTKK